MLDPDQIILENCLLVSAILGKEQFLALYLTGGKFTRISINHREVPPEWRFGHWLIINH